MAELRGYGPATRRSRESAQGHLPMDFRGNSGPRMECLPCLALAELVGQYPLRCLVTREKRSVLDLWQAWSWEIDADEVPDE